LLAIAFLALPAFGQSTPVPQFENGYRVPAYAPGPPRADWLQWVDIAALVVALAMATLLAHKWRSRRGLLLLAIASLAYFGFYRNGCVCAIGAIQNVALGLADPSYVLPLPVIAFFVLPLAMALVAGRVFCGAVCPLGAIQEVVVLRPLAVPAWMEKPLRLLAYIYLAAAVLFAATGAAFVICQYDPFVAIFRLTGEVAMLILGGAVLVLGLFVGRPYCRFFCPMGVLLSLVSRFSAWRVKVTTGQCVRCRLCEKSCPYGAIRVAAGAGSSPPSETGIEKHSGKMVLATTILLTPLLAVAGALLGASLSSVTSRVHPTVQLADRMYLELNHKVEGVTNESDSFRRTRRPVEKLYDEASGITRQFRTGGYAAGGFVGLAAGLMLVGAGLRRTRKEFDADPGSCLACGRCYNACPLDRKRSNDDKVLRSQ
jgi:polyferredoxin